MRALITNHMDNTTSNTSKTVGIIIIVALIAAGVWFMTKRSGTENTDTPQTTTSENQTPVVEQADPAITGVQLSGSSNASLDADLASMDSQMNGFSAENAAAQSATVE